MFTLYLCLNSGSLDFVLCTYGTQAVLILGGIKVFSCYQENVCSLSLFIKRMFAPHLCYQENVRSLSLSRNPMFFPSKLWREMEEKIAVIAFQGLLIIHFQFLYLFIFSKVFSSSTFNFCKIYVFQGFLIIHFQFL